MNTPSDFVRYDNPPLPEPVTEEPPRAPQAPSDEQDHQEPPVTADEQHQASPAPGDEQRNAPPPPADGAHQQAPMEDPRHHVGDPHLQPALQHLRRQTPPPPSEQSGGPYPPEQPYPPRSHGRVPYTRHVSPPPPQPQPAAPPEAGTPNGAPPSPPADDHLGQTEVIEFFNHPLLQGPPSVAGPRWVAAPGPLPASGPQNMTGGGYGPNDDSEILIARRRRPAANSGWRKTVAKMSGGRINPGPSAKQEKHEELVNTIRVPLAGVGKVAFVSAKGGVGKTTMTVAVGSAIARERGDRVIAVDTNTDLGDLAARFGQYGGPHANIEHLAALRDSGRYASVREYTVQNEDRLEALSSQNDPRSRYTLNAQDYTATMRILEKHYNVVLLDCGTSITSSLFSTVASDVTNLVVVAAQNTRGVKGAWDTLHWLHSHGFSGLLQRTVVVLNATDRGKPLIDVEAVEKWFHDLVPAVITVPYDPHLAEGMSVEYEALHPRTRKALMELAGAVAEHYPVRHASHVSRHRSDPAGGY